MSKIILDLCGGTGAWSRPYKRAGYDVRLITLPHYDVTTYTPPKKVYGILCSPPCGDFSLSGAAQTRGTPARLSRGLVTVDACLRIVRECQLETPLQFWALENPRGYLRRFLGRPPLTFERWQYGDKGIKPTDIWGHYKIPSQCPLPERRATFTHGPRDPVRRAITPPGFALAFFRANR